MSSNEEQTILFQAAAITNILSAFGCVFNVSVTVFLGKTRNSLGKMVVVLAILDFVHHFPLIFSSMGAHSNAYCQVVSWITYFGYASAIIFTSCFAHYLHQSVSTASTSCLEKYYTKYLSLTISSGLVVGTLSVILNHRIYDPRREMCVFSRDQPGTTGLSDIIIFLIPGIISIVSCLIYYIRTIILLRYVTERRHFELLVYPLILVVCLSPIMIGTTLLALGLVKNAMFGYRLVCAIAFGSQGLLNSLAYGLSKTITSSIRNCCCYKAKRVEQEPLYHSVSSENSDHGPVL